MERTLEKELLEYADFPAPVVEGAYADLTRIHRWLGDSACILRALRAHPFPPRRILDLGCAAGGAMQRVRRKLDADVIGVDLREWPGRDPQMSFLVADAIREPLPPADAAVAMYLTHHLNETEVVELIRNVGRSCRRLLILDLVRHPLPLALFRIFVAPFVCPVTAADGATSVRRAYTGGELSALVARAVAGTGATFTHRVAPFYIRQVADISFPRPL